MVFAGGGSRCIWQAGFYENIAGGDLLDLQEIASVSAGAFFSCLALSGCMGKAVEYFIDVTTRNSKNAYLENFFTDKPVFPQYEMYKQGLADLIGQSALDQLKQGPDIRILIARPPAWLGPISATVIGLLAYSIEKKISHPVHPKLPRKFGFKPEVVRVRDCATPEKLAELILQSSCTPPFVPIMKRDHFPVLDGGLVDNVPVYALQHTADNILVLLTRQYAKKNIPDIPGRIYVQPSEKIDLDKWDYTNPKGLLAVYELGCRDGEKFLKTYGK